MKLAILGISFALFLVALPLVSWGATDGRRVAWYTGLALMGAAAVLAPVTRWLDKDADKPGDAGNGDGKKAGGQRDARADDAATTGTTWRGDRTRGRVRAGDSAGAAPREDVPRRAQQQAAEAGSEPGSERGSVSRRDQARKRGEAARGEGPEAHRKARRKDRK